MENLPLVPDLVAFRRSVAARPGDLGADHVRGPDRGQESRRRPRPADVQPGHLRPDQSPLHRRGPPRRPRWPRGSRRTPSEFTEDLVTGHFTIDQLPPRLTGHAPGLTYLSMRFTPYGGPAVVPGWLSHQADRPRVALTLGMVAAEKFGGYPIDLAATLDHLADLDIELVVTVPAALRPPGRSGQHQARPLRPPPAPRRHLLGRDPPRRVRHPVDRRPARAAPPDRPRRHRRPGPRPNGSPGRAPR